MKTKNFETFFKENYTKLFSEEEEEMFNGADAGADAPAEDHEESTDVDTENSEPTTTEPAADMSAPVAPTTPAPALPQTTSKAVILYGAVDTMNGQESALSQAIGQIEQALDCCTAECLKLYQLNIQPVSSDVNSPEPADGMAFVYDKLKDADVLIIASPIQDGDVSSLIQTVMKRIANHYKAMELKNKIFASILMGDQNTSQQLVKADLNNQASNLGFIIAPNTTIFDASQIAELVAAIKMIKDATSSIRTVVQDTAVAGVMNYDQFMGASNTANTDLSQSGQITPDAEKGNSFDVTADTAVETPEAPAEEAPAEGSSEVESSEAPVEGETEETAEGEETTEVPEEEGAGEAENTEETAEEEEEKLTKKQEKRLPPYLLNAIKKSKHIKEEEEEIEAVASSSVPHLESKNENMSMKKIHHIARFSEMTTDKTKNQFQVTVDGKKMKDSTINPAPSVKKEVAPDQKEKKAKTDVTGEIKPAPDSSKMKTGSVNPTAGAKSHGEEENAIAIKPAKGETKKGVENFSNFLKKSK